MRDTAIVVFWIVVGLVATAALIGGPLAFATWVIRSVWRAGGR